MTSVEYDLNPMIIVYSYFILLKKGILILLETYIFVAWRRE